MLVASCGGSGKPVSVNSDATSTSTVATQSEQSSKHSTPTTSRSSKTKHTSKAKTKAKGSSAVSPAGTSWSPGSPGTSGPGVVIVPAGGQPGGGSPAANTGPPTTVYRPRPYDPSKPIDLGGYPGVTPAEQARAEKLVRDTLRDLPKYADVNVAYADGYRSIGDALTGDEHYVKWAYANDGRILDTKHPESLVYEMRNGKKTLVAAMFSMPFGSRFTDVPDVGGPLTQWHVHNDLCLADSPRDPLQKVLSGATTINGPCPPGSSKAGAAPMLHVWIVPNKCGPFAALDGVGGGQIPPGQERLCDTIHGG